MTIRLFPEARTGDRFELIDDSGGRSVPVATADKAAVLRQQLQDSGYRAARLPRRDGVGDDGNEGGRRAGHGRPSTGSTLGGEGRSWYQAARSGGGAGLGPGRRSRCRSVPPAV